MVELALADSKRQRGRWLTRTRHSYGTRGTAEVSEQMGK